MAYAISTKSDGEGALPFMHLTEMFEALRLGSPQYHSSIASKGNNDLATGTQTSSQARGSLIPIQSSALAIMFANDVLPILRAVFPPSCIKYEVNDADQLSKNHMQLLIYAMTNNLAGLDSQVSLRMIYDYLKDPLTRLLQSNTVMTSRIGFSIDMPAFQSMMEVYFRCAIEAGDTRAVECLLENPDVKIEANQQSVTVKGVKYTVIERSATLQHLEITRLLLASGADPNRSFRERHSPGPFSKICHAEPTFYPAEESVGALGCAIESHVPGSRTGYSLVRALLETGGTIDDYWLTKIVEGKDFPMIDVLLEHGLHSHFTVWARNRFFHAVVSRLEVHKLSELFTHLYEYGFDFSEMRSLDDMFDGQERNCSRCPPTLMDSLALRGNVDLVIQVLGYGACISNDTVVAVVRSSSFVLVHYLLENGAQVHGFSSYFCTTAFAQAIQMHSPVLIRLMDQYVSWMHMPNESSRWAMLVAMAEIGDIGAVEHLISLPAARNPYDLGYPLLKAAAANHTEVAVMLLEAGASTDINAISRNVESRAKQPERRSSLLSRERPVIGALYSAIKNRNAPLVEKLLEHDAGVEGTLGLAVARNDMSVLEDLIFAGALNTGGSALRVAVKHSSLTCLERLCQAGATNIRNALHKAVRMDAIPAVKLLLLYNCHMLNKDTLKIAMDQSPDMLQLILQYCRKSRPTGIRDLGRSALCKAIKRGCHELAKTLIDAGAALPTSLNYSANAKRHPLAVAICSNLTNSLDFVRMILESGYSIDGALENGWASPSGLKDRKTALMVAVTTNSKAMVQLILSYGANVNTPASRGVRRTPLQIAAEIGSIAMVELLLKAGADVNAAPAQRSGLTALQAAAKGGYIGIVRLLVSHGADPMSPSAPVDGRCAIEAAAEHGRTDMIVYLLRLRVWPTEKLRSAMCFARNGGYESTVGALQHAVKDSNPVISTQPSSLAVRHLDISGTVANNVTPSPPEEIFRALDNDISESDAPRGGPELVSEDICSFSDLGDMDVDIDAQADSPAAQDQHICQTCSPPLALSSASALRRHQRSKHKDIFPALEYECIICLKSFDRRDTYKRHQATHDKQELEACPSCGKRFRKDYLKMHVRACKARAR